MSKTSLWISKFFSKLFCALSLPLSSASALSSRLNFGGLQAVQQATAHQQILSKPNRQLFPHDNSQQPSLIMIHGTRHVSWKWKGVQAYRPLHPNVPAPKNVHRTFQTDLGTNSKSHWFLFWGCNFREKKTVLLLQSSSLK